jgi:hypothetical protein
MYDECKEQIYYGFGAGSRGLKLRLSYLRIL